MNPSVSIITVVYNGSETISDCLKSINIQTVPAEHIIIDGASTDNTLDIKGENYQFKAKGKDNGANLNWAKAASRMRGLIQSLKTRIAG